MAYRDLLRSDGTINEEQVAAIAVRKGIAEINAEMCRAAGLHPRRVRLGEITMWHADRAATLPHHLITDAKRAAIMTREYLNVVSLAHAMAETAAARRPRSAPAREVVRFAATEAAHEYA